MVALLLCGILMAQEIILSLSADQIAMGQVTQLTIDFVNIEDASPPHFPKDGGVSVELRNKKPERNFVYQNGRSRHTLRYRYTVLGVAEGIWNMGPVSIVHDGRSYVSNGVSVTVFRAGKEVSKKTTVEGVLERDTPYAGEVISYHVRVSLREKGIHQEVTPSEYVGFSSIAAPNQKSSHVWEDKELVEVLDIWFPIRAQNESRYEISSAKLLLETQSKGRDLPTSFFQERREQQYFLSPPLMGVIRPLPKWPSTFSGLVGSFQFRAYPRKKVVEVGEPVEIVMEIWGNGYAKGYRAPVFSDDRFEVYDEHPQEIEAFVAGVYTSKWTMKRTLLPIEAGKHGIDPFSIVVFDPQKEKYIELRSDPFVLRVQGQKESSNVSEIETQSKDSTIPSWVKDLPEHRSFSVLPWWSSWGLCVFPMIWWFRKRKKTPSLPQLPRVLPNDPKDKLHVLEQYMQAYMEYCAEYGRSYDHEKIRAAKDVLYSARYGDIDVEDVERTIRMALP